jgi:non-heme chloroperoxidase
MHRSKQTRFEAASTSRRTVLGGMSAAGLASVLSMTAPAHADPEATNGVRKMASIKTSDGTEIFYKDWGPKNTQPIVFHHGWPLSADDWDSQMMFILSNGYRVIAHDRRGHGRSSQTDIGGDMDTYAADMAALTDALDLQNAVHIGHSAGGGEVARYVARSKPGRVAKMVLISAVTPMMLRTQSNPGGLPIEVFDGFRTSMAANRAQFYRDIPAGPFYGFNRAGAKVSEGVIQNWWRQAMMGSIKGQYDCIKALSETDFSEDLKSIRKPTLVMHGDDDQIVPIKDSSVRAAKLVQGAILKVYPGLPHGMCTTHPEVINPDLLNFIKA